MSISPEAAQLLDMYAKNHLYGRLEFIFKAGKLVFIKKEETLVPFDEEVPEVRSREARY